MRVLMVLLAALLGAGCDAGFRNSPEQQIEDHAKCLDGGMDSMANGIGEIWCVPRVSQQGKEGE